MENTSKDDLRKGYRISVLIGIAIIVSLFCYAVVVELIKSEYEPFEGFAPIQEIEILRYVLIGIAVVTFFAIRFIRNILTSAKTTMFTSGQVQFSAPVGRLVTMSIISYALCESVAIYGLVLFLIGGSSLDFYSFAVLSLVYFAVYFPKYSQWEEWVKKMERH